MQKVLNKLLHRFYVHSVKKIPENEKFIENEKK